MKSLLDQIQEKHLEILREKLSTLPSPMEGSGIGLLAAMTFGSKTETFDKRLNAMLNDVNEAFVEELNAREVEEAHTDAERLESYELFRAECSSLVSQFNANVLKTPSTKE